MQILFFCVPEAGIEPARVLPHRFLRPTRLPIPPLGQVKYEIRNTRCEIQNTRCEIVM